MELLTAQDARESAATYALKRLLEKASLAPSEQRTIHILMLQRLPQSVPLPACLEVGPPIPHRDVVMTVVKASWQFPDFSRIQPLVHFTSYYPCHAEEEVLAASLRMRDRRLHLVHDEATLYDMLDDYDYLWELRSRRLRVSVFLQPFAQERQRVYDRLKALTPPAYQQAVTLDPVVLGYTMPHYYKQFDMTGETYKKFRDLWRDPVPMTAAAFGKWFDDNACTDWSKMDVQGECFGGFWHSEDLDERKNAWELTREANLNALIALPYPFQVIQRTIEIGCSTRRESVPYTVLCCEWLKQKMEHMRGIPGWE